MIFVRGSYEPLQQSNYAVILSIEGLKKEDLASNYGFKVSIIYFMAFFLLLFLIQIIERVCLSD